MPTYEFKEGLTAGLRRDSRNEINTQGLVQCYNMKPMQHRLVNHEPVVMGTLESEIASAGITIAHPFPQIFYTRDELLLFTATAVYGVNKSTAVLTAKTLKALDGTSSATITTGGPWQLSDFGDVWMAYNGVNTVFKANIGGTEVVRVDTSVPVQTGCEYRGQAIWGGFDDANYYNANWEALYEGLTDEYIVPTTGVTPAGIGSNFVAWSTIGGGDFFNILYPTLAQTGHEAYLSSGHTASNPIHLDFLRRNEAGFMPMPWSGNVWCVKPLGKYVVVYGDHGIAALQPYNSEMGPTFGLVRIADFGIASRCCVGGDLTGHRFVDEGGILWALSPDLSLEEIGHQEFLSPLVGGQFTVAMEPQRKEFHIVGTNQSSSNVEAFMLTETGFYQHGQGVTSGFVNAGSNVFLFEDLNDDTVTVETDTFDLDSRAIKTIQEIEVGSVSSTDISLTVKYRTARTGSFQTTTPKTLSPEGFASALASGTEFRILLTASDYTLLDRIDYIKIHWREEGRRNMRESILSS